MAKKYDMWVESEVWIDQGQQDLLGHLSQKTGMMEHAPQQIWDSVHTFFDEVM